MPPVFSRLSARSFSTSAWARLASATASAARARSCGQAVVGVVEHGQDARPRPRVAPSSRTTLSRRAWTSATTCTWARGRRVPVSTSAVVEVAASPRPPCAPARPGLASGVAVWAAAAAGGGEQRSAARAAEDGTAAFLVPVIDALRAGRHGRRAGRSSEGPAPSRSAGWRARWRGCRGPGRGCSRPGSARPGRRARRGVVAAPCL